MKKKLLLTLLAIVVILITATTAACQSLPWCMYFGYTRDRTALALQNRCGIPIHVYYCTCHVHINRRYVPSAGTHPDCGACQPQPFTFDGRGFLIPGAANYVMNNYFHVIMPSGGFHVLRGCGNFGRNVGRNWSCAPTIFYSTPNTPHLLQILPKQ